MKLNNKRTLIVGFAFMAICTFWQTYDNIIPLILKVDFKIGDTLAGGIMALDNVLALFMLPLFGAWSDKVNSKKGKRTPFIFFGTISAVLFMIFIPVAANQKNIVLFAIALGMALISMGTFRSPAVSLMPDVTPKPLRSKANAIINLMGTIGGIAALILIKLLVKKEEDPSYLTLFIAVGLIMLAGMFVIFFFVNENKFTQERIQKEKEYGISEDELESDSTGTLDMPKPVKRSLTFLLFSVAFWFMAYNAVTTAFSKYATIELHYEGGDFAGPLIIASAGALLAYIPVGIVSSKLGRKKVILFGVLLLGACFFSGTFFKTQNFALNIVFMLVGVAWASINVNSYPMVVEMCKGSDIGKFTGMYYTFSMAAQVVTPILSGALLEYVGYRTLFPYATFFAIVAFVTMLQVKHGDSKPQAPKSKLEAFDVDD